MKRFFVFNVLFLFVSGIYAQCNSCTITISGTDPLDRIISTGQVVCVQPSGTITGRLLIQSGGVLCNQGHINTYNLYVSVGGTFNNYGTTNADSLLVSSAGAVLNNYGTITDNRLAVAGNATINNTGTMTCELFGDSTGNFNNNGSFTINLDFLNGYGGTFTNSGQLIIKRDFYNDLNSTMTSNCMATVQRDWYNQGVIKGPASGCGGFSVTGSTLNSGTVGATGHVDICDLGHPTFGIDGNSGTMTGVTYCQCSNTCLPLGMEDITAAGITIYPNPTADRVHITFDQESGGELQLINFVGERIQSWTMPKGIKDFEFSVANFPEGLYFIGYGQSVQKLQIIR